MERPTLDQALGRIADLERVLEPFARKVQTDLVAEAYQTSTPIVSGYGERAFVHSARDYVEAARVLYRWK